MSLNRRFFTGRAHKPVADWASQLQLIADVQFSLEIRRDFTLPQFFDA